jgi:lactoylglutathione lyase
MRPLAAIVLGVTVASLPLIGLEPIKRPPLVGIDHVVFRTADGAAALTFYGELLGLPRVQGGFRVNARQRLFLEPGLPPGTDERLDHIAFATSDLDTLGAYLRDKGMTIEGPAAYPPCLRPALRVKDPEGHLIEFVKEDSVVAAAGPRSDVALSSRLLHAGVTVHDEASANRFYHDVLGMDEIWRGGFDPSKTNWVNLRLPESVDYLEYMLRDTPSTRRQLGVDHHICLLVPDIQAAWEQVRARTPVEKRSALEPPRIGRNQKWQLNLYDPDGTRVELMEPFNVK